MKINLLPSENAILTAAMDACMDHGLVWEMLESENRPELIRADALIRLVCGGRKIKYLAQVKRGLRPATVNIIQQQLTELGGNALLVADYVSPPMAETLRDRGIQFIDTAGNAYLRQPRFFVWVKGQRSQEVPLGKKASGRAFQSTGLIVVFSLLCEPAWANRPYREIAHYAGVAHGTVGWVMPELTNLGYVATVNGKRRLMNSETLLRRWVEAYALTLRPGSLLGRYHSDNLNWTAKIDPEKYNLLLGGEPAAQVLTRHFRPGTATFYGEKVEPRFLLDQRLRPDPHGNVEIVNKFWAFDSEPSGMVPQILIYADLLASGDARCLTVGKEIYGRIIHRFN